jgi:hypothetical protein
MEYALVIKLEELEEGKWFPISTHFILFSFWFKVEYGVVCLMFHHTLSKALCEVEGKLLS